MASVGDITFPAILDSGADFCVLPEEIVPATSRINEKIRIKGYDGKSEVREMAEVRIKIGNVVLKEKVVLVK